MSQLTFFEKDIVEPKSKIKQSTFINNLGLPIHRWFRYSAGFSAEWVNEIIKKNNATRILDPFVGSGTVLIEAEKCGAESIGIESHPFISRVIKAKLLWRCSYREFNKFALHILKKAQNIEDEIDDYPTLIKKCYPEEVLTQLDLLKKSLIRTKQKTEYWQLTWLALISILRITSPVGTAQWQYILPQKCKRKVIEPFKAFEEQVFLMTEDMRQRQQLTWGPEAKIFQEDARECCSVPDQWADLVITSPPYANNYDYADATRLEMSFLNEISSWGDLQKRVRSHLIHSCTQHVSAEKIRLENILEQTEIKPIKKELEKICKKLEIERLNHGGKKQYHLMVASYFLDLAKVWNALRKKTQRNSKLCFVIGDSAPYGIYVPVDKFLGDLAVSAGFNDYAFEQIRDRNVKWKNRKHSVPLKEGFLWVRG